MSGIFGNCAEDQYFESKLFDYMDNSDLSINTTIYFDDYQFKVADLEFSVSGSVEIVNSNIGQIYYTEAFALINDDWEETSEALKALLADYLDSCSDFAEYLYNKI